MDEVVIGSDVGRGHRVRRLAGMQRRMGRVLLLLLLLRRVGEGRWWRLLGVGRVVERRGGRVRHVVRVGRQMRRRWLRLVTRVLLLLLLHGGCRAC